MPLQIKYQAYGAFYSAGTTPDNMSPEDQVWFYALQSHKRLIDDYPTTDNIDIHLLRLIEIGLWDAPNNQLGWQLQHVRRYAAVLGDRLSSKLRGLESKVRDSVMIQFSIITDSCQGCKPAYL